MSCAKHLLENVLLQNYYWNFFKEWRVIATFKPPWGGLRQLDFWGLLWGDFGNDSWHFCVKIFCRIFGTWNVYLQSKWKYTVVHSHVQFSSVIKCSDKLMNLVESANISSLLSSSVWNALKCNYGIISYQSNSNKSSTYVKVSHIPSCSQTFCLCSYEFFFFWNWKEPMSWDDCVH